MQAGRHHYELDLLRIVAAINIVLFHYTFRGYAADSMSVLSFSELGTIFKYGYLGVDLFFMISGFTVLLSASSKGFTDFVISRISRLYPAFWIAVTLTAIVTWLFGDSRYHIDLKQYLLNLTMVSGYFGIKPVDDAYWFLLVLIRFYFIVSLVLVLQQVRNMKYIAGVWIVASMIVTFVRIPGVSVFLVPEYSAFFIAGMMFFLAKEQGMDLYKIVVIVSSFVLASYNCVKQTISLETHYNSSFSAAVVVGSILACYVSFFLVIIYRSPATRRAGLMLFGSATYPLYLLHHNIGFIVFNYVGDRINKYAVLTGTIAAMIFLSMLISHYLEPHIREKVRNSAVAMIKILSQIATRQEPSF